MSPCRLCGRGPFLPLPKGLKLFGKHCRPKPLQAAGVQGIADFRKRKSGGDGRRIYYKEYGELKNTVHQSVDFDELYIHGTGKFW